MPAKKKTDDGEIKSSAKQFRIQISITPTRVSEAHIRELAKRHGYEQLTSFDSQAVQTEDERKAIAAMLNNLIVEAVKSTAEKDGSADITYTLSDAPEPRFTTVRNKPRIGSDGKPVEALSQAEAIRHFLRLQPGAPIVLSEDELVTHAIRAAREQNRGRDYGVEDLVREGLAMACQAIISKHVAATNLAPGAESPTNLPGSNDDHYLDVLKRLREANADPDIWFSSKNPFGRKRKREITMSVLSRACGTNDVVIRAFLRRHGITDIVDPSLEKAAAQESDQD